MKEIIRKQLIPQPEYPKVKRGELKEFPIPCYAQVKYDGELTYLQKGEEEWFTINRWGRIRTKYPVTDLSHRLIKQNHTFIGELYVEGEDLYSFLKKRSSGEQLKLAVFDVQMEKPYRERYHLVAETFPPPNEHKVHIPQGKLVKTRQELEDFYHKAVDRGYEGIVGRSPHSPYQQPALKKKKMKTADLVILGIVKDSTLFQEENLVGSVLVGCAKNGDYVPVGRVASGFTTEEREALYQALIPFKTGEDEDFVYVKPALVIEVSFQETVESSRYPVGFTMRSPVFQRFRTDKKPNQKHCGLQNQFPNQ